MASLVRKEMGRSEIAVKMRGDPAGGASQKYGALDEPLGVGG
jgi:hypothetical protein